MNIEEKIQEIEHNVRKSALIIPPNGDEGHALYLKNCASEVTIDGLWIELGVYRGRTITNLASYTNKDIFGLDSFEGLHEEWDENNPKGVYSLNGEIPAGVITGKNEDNWGMYDARPTKTIKPWPKNVKLIKGYFDKTLPLFLERFEGDIAFLHVDCDLYSSTKSSLDILKSRIKKGTIIAFDELIGYNRYKEHEIKAFSEFLLDTGLAYECLYHQNPDNYGQACIKIK